jgi:hypothetical protein
MSICKLQQAREVLALGVEEVAARPAKWRGFFSAGGEKKGKEFFFFFFTPR